MLAVQPGGPTRQRRFISTSVKILFTPQNYLRIHAFFAWRKHLVLLVARRLGQRARGGRCGRPLRTNRRAAGADAVLRGLIDADAAHRHARSRERAASFAELHSIWTRLF